MELKKLRNICIVIWTLIGVINIILYLNGGSAFILLLGGFWLGVAFECLINNPHMIWLEKHNKIIMKHWSGTIENLRNAYEKIRELEVKKGKKK